MTKSENPDSTEVTVMAEEENRLAAAAPLQMEVDQIENLQNELQVNEGGGPPPEQPAQQNNDGQPPNVQQNPPNNVQGNNVQGNNVQGNNDQVNNQGNNNWNNNAVQNVFPPDRHPKYHDVPAPRGNAYQLQRGQKLVHQCPKYARKRPWRQYVCEFFSWVETFEIYQCGDEFIKDTMVWSMKGQAMDMIHPHRAGSVTYANNPTWRSYARAVEHIFAPKAESQLAKQEFKTYRQGQTEDISSYLATKRALFDVAYGQFGPFDTLLDEVINGIINKEVKRELRMRNPRTAEEMSMHAVQIVANVRAAYENGYGLSESKSGLYHTTMLAVRENQEEPMEVTAMKRKMKAMEEQLNAMNSGNAGMKCFKCNRTGHLARDCRIPGGNRGGRGGANRGGLGRGKDGRGGSTQGGGRFQYNCHYCKKPGHKIADCYKKKKDDQNQKKDGGGKTRTMGQNGQEEEEEAPNGYNRFLDLEGELEQN